MEEACRLAKENRHVRGIDLASFNVVTEMLPHFKDVISKYVDIVFANEEEARAFTGLGPREALDSIAEKCTIAVVKTGANGSWIKRGEEVIKIDALKVTPVDTIFFTTSPPPWFSPLFQGLSLAPAFRVLLPVRGCV